MHPLLEKDHQQLINFLDAMDDCMSAGNSVNQVHKYLSEFIALVEEEFKNEEIIMETYKYTDIISHKKEHVDLFKQLSGLKNKLDNGHTPFGRDYVQLLRRWLENHLFDADSRLDKFLYQVNENNK